MARIRTIKPEFWTDEKVGKLKRDERLLFIGLWNLADDQGVVKANAAYIKGQLFSYDEELRISTVDNWLASMAKARMLIPFTFNSESYYLIRTFDEHQLINRPSKPKFPQELIDQLLSDDSQDAHGILSEYSQPEGKGKGKDIGKEGEDGFVNKKDVKPLPEFKNPFSENFLSAWQQWKAYKATEFKFSYKSVQSEQAAINELVKLSKGMEHVAEAIIHQSMAKGWKGLFELKDQAYANEQQRTAKQATGAGVSTGSILSKIDAMPD